MKKPKFDVVYKCLKCGVKAEKRRVGWYSKYYCPKCGATEKNGLIPVFIIKKSSKRLRLCQKEATLSK